MTTTRARLGLRLARLARRAGHAAASGGLAFLCRVLPALPGPAVLALADSLAPLFYALDARGRRAGHENLTCVFGPVMPPSERKRILLGSYRNVVRAVLLLFHVQPATPERYARWVRMDPADEARFQGWAEKGRRAVVLSAHFGNWELLVASRTGIRYSPSFAYLVETSGNRALDHVLDRLRDGGAGGGALRKRGAFPLKRALEEGRCISLLVDRNVRSSQGGRYVPFLGLPGRTTPLGAVLARRFDVPLAVALMIPDGRARYRMWVSHDLRTPTTGDDDADVLAYMARVNEVIGAEILKRPEAWLWSLKRWKSRPTPEQGRYPSYSIYDPDV